METNGLVHYVELAIGEHFLRDGLFVFFSAWVFGLRSHLVIINPTELEISLEYVSLFSYKWQYTPKYPNCQHNAEYRATLLRQQIHKEVPLNSLNDMDVSGCFPIMWQNSKNRHSNGENIWKF
jgi:hypothetical protein